MFWDLTSGEVHSKSVGMLKFLAASGDVCAVVVSEKTDSRAGNKSVRFVFLSFLFFYEYFYLVLVFFHRSATFALYKSCFVVIVYTAWLLFTSIISENWHRYAISFLYFTSLWLAPSPPLHFCPIVLSRFSLFCLLCSSIFTTHDASTPSYPLPLHCYPFISIAIPSSPSASHLMRAKKKKALAGIPRGQRGMR